MIYIINGKQYDVPKSAVNKTEIVGIAVVQSGAISAEDIDAADNDAVVEFGTIPKKLEDRVSSLNIKHKTPMESTGTQQILLRRERLYFQLSDSSIFLSPPIGQQASHLKTYWRFSWASKSDINNCNTNNGEDEGDSFLSIRTCTIDGKQYRISSKFVDESKSTFMIRSDSGTVSEADIARLDLCANEFFDESVAKSNCVEIQRMRLYFELEDGSITHVPPIGKAEWKIQCCSTLQTISRENFERLTPEELPVVDTKVNSTDELTTDPLLEDVKKMLIETRTPSVSLTQRTFLIGYARAENLLKSLEGELITPRNERGLRRMLDGESIEYL